jgi:hypothetical protein
MSYGHKMSGQRDLETRYCRYWSSTRHIGYARQKCFAQWTVARRIANVSRLMGHLRGDHGVREEDTQDLVRFFIGTMLPGRLKVNLQRTNGTQARGEWNVERCHCPGCGHLHAIHNRIERDLQQHPDMRANIETLG